MKNITRTLRLIVLASLFIVSSIQAQDLLSQLDLDEQGIETLEVEGKFLKVTVEGGDRSSVSVTGRIYGNKERYTLRHQRTGSTLRVWVEVENKMKSWNNGNFKGSIACKVPRKTNLIVKNSSGSLDIDQISASTFRLGTSSGSIKAQNIQANGNYKSSSGSIRVSNVQGNIEALSSSGSQSWTNIDGNIITKASSGTIRFNNLKGDVKSVTSSGGMSVNNLDGTLDLSASSGSIRGEGIQLKGDSRFKTSSGGIRISLKNSLSNLGFDLTASSGSIQVGGERHKKRYYTSQGGIKISGVSSSGSQSYTN